MRLPVVLVNKCSDPESHSWHVAVALLPLIPAVWLIWVQWRVVRRSDEFQRTAHLEALAIGFAVAMVAALTAGLLDAVDVGSGEQWLQITFIGGILAWIAALAAVFEQPIDLPAVRMNERDRQSGRVDRLGEQFEHRATYASVQASPTSPRPSSIAWF